MAGIFPDVPQQQRVCQPGEIRQEYESFLAQQTQEARQRRRKEEGESIKLIQALQVCAVRGVAGVNKLRNTVDMNLYDESQNFPPKRLWGQVLISTSPW